MSERYIEICNWERFQHKDVWRKSGGRPPWIKNYTALLHNDEYMSLTAAQRGVLHGLWLMYASSGLSPNENTSRRLLSTNKGDSRHFQDTLEALRDAGFIRFLSQPRRSPDAPRVEERREDPPSIPPTAEPSRKPTEAEIARAREDRERNGYVPGLSDYTGCRIVRGEVGLSHVYDPLGKEPPPSDWPYQRPTREEIREALILA